MPSKGLKSRVILSVVAIALDESYDKDCELRLPLLWRRDDCYYFKLPFLQQGMVLLIAVLVEHH